MDKTTENICIRHQYQVEESILKDSDTMVTVYGTEVLSTQSYVVICVF